MVAQTIELPNIRKFFIPDPGYIIADADLAGADAQVVAWEANDEDLKEAFRKGLKLHIKNARDIFPEKVRGWSDEAIKATDRSGGIYHNCKRAVHLSNYGGKPKTMAAVLNWTIRESDRFQTIWFDLHPGILDWHERVEDELQRTRSVSNKFGYRIVYFDRVETLLPEALAWIPQSTVAINCRLGALNVYENLPWVKLLLEVHDNLVFQYPRSKHASRDLIRQQLQITVPYDDPLTIQWGLKTSEKSWGDAQPTAWAA